MALEPGQKLGPYKVIEPIGKGGMGEVYRARDTKLDRDVAIKVLPDELAADEERVVRFEREAKLLASLNHPNIASIYGFEGSPQPERSAERSGVAKRDVVGVGPRDTNKCALVLELVEGPTLAERIERGPIPVDEAIAIAKQIAEALEAGHEAGVIHRDLKLANIKLKEDGTVKVLDYGLAKALEGDAPSGTDAELSQSPTLTRQGTQVGVILGTAAYMSPEQAKGKRVDKRTDIWAFGVVLYEMLTGEKTFPGEGVSDVLAAVIKTEPDWEKLPMGTDPSVERVLRRCLQKDPTHRMRDIGDARIELTEAGLHRREDKAPTFEPAFWQKPLWLLVAASLLVALTWFAGWDRSGTVSREETITRYVVALPDTDTLNMTSGGLAVAPDGQRLAYVANRDGVKQLYVRERDQVSASAIPGTEGAEVPFFSPDGQWLAFFRGRSLMKVSLAGGAPQLVCDVPAGSSLGASWSSAGTIIVGRNTRALSVPAAGGTPEVLESRGTRFPFVLPDGESVLLGEFSGEVPQVILHNLASGEDRVLIDGDQARVVSNYLIVARQRSLWAAPFDVARVQVTGPAQPVVDGVFRPRASGASYDFSSEGTLAFVPTAPKGSLSVVDPSGESTELMPLEDFHSVRLSPDGRRIVGDNGTSEVWVYSIESGTRLKVAAGAMPAWSPDGSDVAYLVGASLFDEESGIAIKSADGTGDERVFLRRTGGQSISPSSWSPDGEWVAVDRNALQSDSSKDIWMSSLAGEAEPFLATPANEFGAMFSPDGRWIAYQSDQTGRYEVYVVPFRGPGERVAVSARGGSSPIWSPDGSELYYRQDTAVMAVSVEANEDFSVTSPRQLLDGQYWLDVTGHVAFGVFPDGKLLMIETGQANEIHVVLNWVEELKRFVPTDGD